MKEKKRIVPKYMWVPIILALLCNSLAYFGTRIFTTGRYHYVLSSRLDDMIPVVPYFIIIYWGCYLYWGINYVIGCRQEKDEAYNFISADFFAKIICMIIFMVFPTTNVRPVIEGGTFWNDAMLGLYGMDAADNLFPSIHCLTSWFCFIAVRKNNAVPKAYKVISFIIAVLVFISTLTTKQHVIVDVVGGVALAEFSYWFVRVSGFTRIYRRILERREYVQ